jgi:hypothetical protein
MWHTLPYSPLFRTVHSGDEHFAVQGSAMHSKFQ